MSNRDAEMAVELSFAEAFGTATGLVSCLTVDEYGDHALAALDMRRRVEQVLHDQIRVAYAKDRSTADSRGRAPRERLRDHVDEDGLDDSSRGLPPALSLVLARMLRILVDRDGLEGAHEREDAVAKPLFTHCVSLVEAPERFGYQSDEVTLQLGRELGLDYSVLCGIERVANLLDLLRRPGGVGQRDGLEVMAKHPKESKEVRVELRGRSATSRGVPGPVDREDESVQAGDERVDDVRDLVADGAQISDPLLDFSDECENAGEFRPEGRLSRIVAEVPCGENALVLGNIPVREDVSEQQRSVGHGETLAAFDSPVTGARPRTWCLWNLPTYLWPVVGDYTSHSRGWPYVCQHRGELPAGNDVTVTLVCTRRADHTGRHAHGSGVLVDAVWEDS